MGSTIERDNDNSQALRSMHGAPCVVCGMPEICGVAVLGKRICGRCEKAITALDISDDVYDFYVAKLKDLWRTSSGRET